MAIAGGIDICDRPQLRIGPEDQIVPRRRELRFAALAVFEREALRLFVGLLPDQIDIGQVPEKVVGQHAHLVGEYAMLRAVIIAAQHAQTTGQRRPFGRRQLHEIGLVQEEFLWRHAQADGGIIVRDEVAETIDDRLQPLKAFLIGQILGGIDAARRERHRHLDARILGCLLDRRAAAQHDQISQRSAAATLAVVIVHEAAQCFDHRNCALIDRPVLLRGQGKAATIGTATLVAVTIGHGRRESRKSKVGYGQAAAEDGLFERGDIAIADGRAVQLRDRILP